MYLSVCRPKVRLPDTDARMQIHRLLNIPEREEGQRQGSKGFQIENIRTTSYLGSQGVAFDFMPAASDFEGRTAACGPDLHCM